MQSQPWIQGNVFISLHGSFWKLCQVPFKAELESQGRDSMFSFIFIENFHVRYVKRQTKRNEQTPPPKKNPRKMQEKETKIKKIQITSDLILNILIHLHI